MKRALAEAPFEARRTYVHDPDEESEIWTVRERGIRYNLFQGCREFAEKTARVLNDRDRRGRSFAGAQ